MRAIPLGDVAPYLVARYRPMARESKIRRPSSSYLPIANHPQPYQTKTRQKLVEGGKGGGEGEGEEEWTHDDRNLAKGRFLDERGELMFARCEVDLDELPGDAEFLGDEDDAAGAGGHGVAVDFEDHGLIGFEL